MEIVLPPILTAIRRLESAGITVDTMEGRNIVRGKLLMGVFDRPAKSSATNMKQCNGKYGCNYCTDEGHKNLSSRCASSQENGLTNRAMG